MFSFCRPLKLELAISESQELIELNNNHYKKEHIKISEYAKFQHDWSVRNRMANF